MSRSVFQRSLVPVLAVLAGACIGCVSCAKEIPRMTTQAPARSVAAADVFTDKHVAELARAIAAGDVSGVERLAAQTDLAARGRDSVTLLEWAVLNRQPAALAALLKAGADPSLQGLDGETVLHLAAQADDPQYLRILLDGGADANLLSRGRKNALINALDAARSENLRLLLDAGADPAQADAAGYTPLHAAAMLRDFDSVLLLLERGADPAARSSNGATFQYFVFPDRRRVPLNAKAKQGQQDIAAWLRAHDITVEGEPQQ